MGALAEAVRRITVTATSPDGTITARMSGDRSIAVSFGENAMRRHTDASLAQAIEKAVNGSTGGFRKALATVYERRYGTSLDFTLPPDASPVLVAAREAEGELAVAETSARGNVKVGVGGKGRIQLRIRPGTVDRIDITVDGLLEEINTTIAAARATYGRRATDTFNAIKDDHRKKGR